MNDAQPHVGLFVTCLVDLFRPSVGFAAVKLLEQAGCRVSVPQAQTCCAQPAYNNGDRADSAAIAKGVIAAFADFDYVVVPSGSCGGMIKLHYPEMFAGDAEWAPRAEELAGRTWELTQFLVDVRGWDGVAARLAGTATYHDSCASLREHGVKDQPRALLAKVDGLTVTEMAATEVCCGFGGTFCIKYPEISNHMVAEKVANIRATGADLVLAGDLGCLLNIAGKLKREGDNVEVRHVAEILAGMTDTPAIGEAEG
ncbi:MAG: (Fe-S)-binding protein [Alphaproteobacteria bacterium]|nr:(Fe-S)-binding protein [Alphaproteobacteria bacterium]